jgi:hypothetical protein
MTKNTIILVIILLYLAFVGMVVAYLLYYTDFSGWLTLLSVILTGVVIMERFADRLSKILKEPRLKVIDSRRKSHGEGSEGEYLDIYLIIKNTGGEWAEDCKVYAKVKHISENSYNISGVPFSLNAGDSKEIHFLRIIKSEHKTRDLTGGTPTLDRGKIYEYEITFSGANFEAKKKHRLKLDLSSWENIKVILDC